MVGMELVFKFIEHPSMMQVELIGMLSVMIGMGLPLVVGIEGMIAMGSVEFSELGESGMEMGSTSMGIGLWELMKMGEVLEDIEGELMGFKVMSLTGASMELVQIGFGALLRMVIPPWVRLQGGNPGVKVN